MVKNGKIGLPSHAVYSSENICQNEQWCDRVSIGPPADTFKTDSVERQDRHTAQSEDLYTDQEYGEN